MSIKCRINEEEIIFTNMEEIYKFDRYNKITFLDCFNNGITKNVSSNGFI